MTNFTVDRVDWHTETRGDPEPLESARRRFYALVSFLQREGLLVEALASCPEEIGPEFAVRSESLTPMGLELIRRAYSDWMDSVEVSGRPDDTSILERALATLRTAT